MNRSIFLNELKTKDRKTSRFIDQKLNIKDFDIGPCIGKGKFS
jgi:hypothetical protein